MSSRRRFGAPVLLLSALVLLFVPSTAHADADPQVSASGPTQTTPGATVTYTVKASNVGDDVWTDAMVMVSLDHAHLDPTRPYVTFVSGTGGCAAAGPNLVQCSFGSLAAGASAQGSLTVTLTAHAPAGGHVVLTGSASPDDNFTVSTYVVPSELSFTAMPAAWDSNTTPTFAFGAQGASAYECRIDNGAWATCSSPYTTPALAAGQHTFRARVAGADATTKSHAWTIDTVAPTVTAVRVESLEAGFVTTDSPAVTYDAADDNQVVGWECRIDRRPIGCSTAGTELGPLTERRHDLMVRALDLAGNRSDWRRVRFIVDTVAPRIEVTAGPTAMTSSTTATFLVRAGNEPTKVQYFCSLDARPFRPCAEARFAKLTFDDLSTRAHRLRIRALDQLGRRSNVVTERWTVTHPPTLRSITGPDGFTRSTSASFTFEANEGRAVRFTCSLDGQAFIDCPGRLTARNLDEGHHRLSIHMEHVPSGNTRLVVRQWTVDSGLTPKLWDTAGPYGIRYGTTSQVVFRPNKPGVTVTCRLDGVVVDSNCSSPFVLRDLSYGKHTLVVVAQDTFGRSSRYSWSWQVVRLPELVNSYGPGARINDRSTSFQLNTNKSGITMYCQKVSTPSGGAATSSVWHLCADRGARSARYVWSKLVPGDHRLRVALVDTLGNRVEYSWRFTVTREKPTLQVSTEASGTTSSRSASFTWWASNRSADEMTYSCILDDVLTECSSPFNLRNLPAGEHTFAVQGWDREGNITTLFKRTWTITPLFTERPAFVTPATFGSFLATGGGSIIAAGGGNIISAGGGNIIAAGGGNIIAAGGGNIISTGGGNIIAAGGGNIIATGGGNIIATGGGNIIATGGGNLIGHAGGNIIAPGGGN